ncbi:MAG: aldehyde dehydrogenase [Candidatus Poseidoniales archaeon]|nr:MAG: aldehyde dehydrogenase [Candidatus Poseidoniales archaeon]
MAMTEETMWVAGEWCAASDDATGEVLNPATGETIASVPRATIADVDRAVDASRTALNAPEWKAMDPAQRGRILNKMAAVTYQHAKSLAKLESENNGKTFREALSEIRYGAWTLEYYAGMSDKIEGSTIPVPGPRLNYTLRQPLGVTAHIVPWNFPLQLALRSIAPALAAGCTVIAKPASWTPLSLLSWARVIDEADVGLPTGVLQVLTGSGAIAGDALAGHPGVDGVVLTGGVPTGQAVMAKASENLTPVTLELGGKGANVVFSDANLRYAAKAICFGIFMNAGQMCWAGSRLLVHHDIHDALVEAVCAEVSKWPVGPGLEDGVRMGSLVHQRHREDVLEKLARGLKDGGKVVLGGNALDREGAFMEATVVTGVLPTNSLFQEELFGPVLTVTPFETDEEALKMANDTPFGLLNGVWTNDLGRAHRMARDLECGMVSINEYPITFPQTAFTGWKHSGIGVEQSQDALRFYTKVKNVNVKL